MRQYQTARDLPRFAASLAAPMAALAAAGFENVTFLPLRAGQQRQPPILDVISC